MILRQRDPADAAFYVQQGEIKLKRPHLRAARKAILVVLGTFGVKVAWLHNDRATHSREGQLLIPGGLSNTTALSKHSSLLNVVLHD